MDSGKWLTSVSSRLFFGIAYAVWVAPSGSLLVSNHGYVGRNVSLGPKIPGCGAELGGNKGTFSSPKYPSRYHSHAVCRWTIRAPPSRRVTLYFDDFSIEEGVELVRVLDELSLNKTFSGDLPPKVTLLAAVSQTNVLTVLLETNGGIRRRGFKAEFHADETSPCSCPDQTLEGDSGELESPSVYSQVIMDGCERVECLYHVRVPDGYRIRFSVLSSALRKGDHLSIFEDSRPDHPIADSSRTGVRVTTETNRAIVNFTFFGAWNSGDVSPALYGFRISYLTLGEEGRVPSGAQAPSGVREDVERVSVRSRNEVIIILCGGLSIPAVLLIYLFVHCTRKVLTKCLRRARWHSDPTPSPDTRLTSLGASRSRVTALGRESFQPSHHSHPGSLSIFIHVPGDLVFWYEVSRKWVRIRVEARNFERFQEIGNAMLENVDRCVICFQRIRPPPLPCNQCHVFFCKDCLVQLVASGTNNCSACRGPNNWRKPLTVLMGGSNSPRDDLLPVPPAGPESRDMSIWYAVAERWGMVIPSGRNFYTFRSMADAMMQHERSCGTCHRAVESTSPRCSRCQSFFCANCLDPRLAGGHKQCPVCRTLNSWEEFCVPSTFEPDSSTSMVCPGKIV